jgi:tetratricopeptide (TPR) repeat protein
MTLLRIFISSPGDVAQERALARRVLGRVQAAYAGRVALEPVLWEQQPLLATATFQTQLVHPSQADIVLAIVWARLGTPLPESVHRDDGSRYRSGTEFEIEDALRGARTAGRPRVVLYRKTAEPRIWFASAEEALEATRQREALEDFLAAHLRDRDDGSFVGAFHPFRNTAEFEELVEVHLHKLVRELVPGLADAAPVASAAWAFGSPFRGLRSFELEHAPLFFGRTAATTAAVEKLQDQARKRTPFLLLLGMSGGGKSSLAQAGILQMIMQPGVVDGVATWGWAVFRPGDGRGDLLRVLAHALCSSTALPELADAALLASRLRADPAQATVDIAAALASRSNGSMHIALVIDQLEEIFSDPAVDADERSSFVHAIEAMLADGRIWIVATMRSDFYSRCVELPALVAMKEGGQFDVQPPGSAEISQMIRMPAAAAGLRYERDAQTGEGLDERLRDAMAGRPSALPLLQFTLEELYRRRSSDGVLTFAAYQEIGGLEGALAHRADSVFAEQPQPVQAALPRVLGPLVTVSEEEDAFGRRHAPLDAFEDAESRQLVQALVDARLLVSDLASDGTVQVAVAHEALIRHWPRAVEWLQANRELLRIRERVRAAALRWSSEARRADFLLSPGKPLGEAVQLRDSAVRLDPLEHAFIAASDQRRRRSRAVRRGAVAALAVLSVAATAAAVFAVRQAEVARREATTASRTSDFLTSMFAIADPGEDRGSRVTARELLDRGASKIRTELRDEPLIRAGMMNTMGAAYSGLGLYEPAMRLTAEARDERIARLGRYHADTLRSQNAYAAALYLAGDYDKAEAAFRDAREIAATVFPRGDAERIRADVGLAEVLSAAGKPEAAQPIFESALRDLDLLPGDMRRERTYAVAGLATALYFQGKLDEASAAFQQARTIGEEALGADHPKVLESTSNLASIAYQKADYRRAGVLWSDTLPRYRATFGAEHAEVAGVLNNLGRVALVERRFDAAVQRLQEALALDRRYKDADHDDLILPLNSLGLARMGLGDHAGAAKDFDEALRIASAHKHWMTGVILTNVADLDLRRGDLTAAQNHAREARTALEQAFPRDAHKDEAWRYDLLASIEGSILSTRGELAEARALVVDPVDRLAARFGEGSVFAVDAMGRAARHFERARDQRAAAQMAERMKLAQRGST